MIFRKTIVLAALIMATSCGATNEKDNESPTETSPADYVSTLVGSLSSFEISTGNTYPAIALPWGMNFWTPQTGKMATGGLTDTTLTAYVVSNRRTSPRHG